MLSQPSSSYRTEILTKLNRKTIRQKKIKKFIDNYANLAEKKAVASLASNESVEINSEVNRLNEEISELYKIKCKNDQVLIDTKQNIAKMEAQIADAIREKQLLQSEKETLCTSIAKMEVEVSNLKQENSAIRDEHLVNQMSHNSLIQQNKVLEAEQIQLLNKIRELNELRVQFMNDEVDQQESIRQKRIESQIASALLPTDMDAKVNSTLAELSGKIGDALLGDVLPSAVQFRLNTNQGEVNEIHWLDSETFATGGGDRNVQVWRIDSKNLQSKIATLAGCNAAITRIDYCREKRTVLASSNDHTIRLWNADRKTLMTTFTGHTDKVSSARFYQNSRVVSGSFDRQLKIWDTISQRCERNFYAGSTVLDVVERCNMSGRGFISGHYDKNIRFWDDRTPEAVQVLEVGNRVTSLDVLQGSSLVLCSTRDDTLTMIDIRNNKPLHFYSAEQYKTSSDLSRAVISAGGEFVVAGSSNGTVFIWNRESTRLVKMLRSTTMNPILSLAWHNSGRGLLSADKYNAVVHYE